MRLTRQTNYAFRILMYCAANPEPRSRVADIAKTHNLSELFLFKIIQPLVEAGMIQTTRGRNGGIALAKPAERISLLDVVRVTEDNFAMAQCFEEDQGDCPLVDNCELNAALRKALNAFFEVLGGYTIGDLVAKRKKINSLLGLPMTA